MAHDLIHDILGFYHAVVNWDLGFIILFIILWDSLMY